MDIYEYYVICDRPCITVMCSFTTPVKKISKLYSYSLRMPFVRIYDLSFPWNRSVRCCFVKVVYKGKFLAYKYCYKRVEVKCHTFSHKARPSCSSKKICALCMQITRIPQVHLRQLHPVVGKLFFLFGLQLRVVSPINLLKLVKLTIKSYSVGHPGLTTGRW